ncbi:TetR/AcrR family transcriptional regulator [Dietzia cinnamea]|uniref:TetR family transcriptional regulator n=1 Tax=Dietzia cinnamea TaxID=321318 RepID=A0A4R3ZNW9_9ACTN|nr:TetR/AcrR family transcriptional regulator [Dietzia cinnamea]TCW20047.1 TetR family transcriptional regulator [Dietzia cinnamea]
MRSRDSILEAAREVIGRAGFGGVTIAAVAKQANVSRQTIYSIFGSREELVSQAVAERLTMLTGAFADLLENSDSPLELIVGIAVEGRNRVLGDPLLRVLALGGGANPMFDPGAAARTHEYCMALLAPAAERFPELAGRLDLVADVGMHVGWSVLCLDSPAARSDDDLRAFLTTWLAPLMQTFTKAGSDGASRDGAAWGAGPGGAGPGAGPGGAGSGEA